MSTFIYILVQSAVVYYIGRSYTSSEKKQTSVSRRRYN